MGNKSNGQKREKRIDEALEMLDRRTNGAFTLPKKITWQWIQQVLGNLRPCWPSSVQTVEGREARDHRAARIREIKADYFHREQEAKASAERAQHGGRYPHERYGAAPLAPAPLPTPPSVAGA